MVRLFVLITFIILSLSAKAQNSHDQKAKNQTIKASPADIILGLETPQQTKKVKAPPLIIGSAELGFLYKTGNTKSGDIKTGIDFRFEKGAWLSLLDIDLLLKKSDITDKNGKKRFKTTDQKWTITSQSNFNLDNKEKNYIYGNIWFEENEFSGFDNQSSISTGWGRHWYKSSAASLWGDIGPGYKRDLYKSTETEPQRTADTFIVQLQALYIRKLGGHVELKQYLSAKQALDTSENSIYKAQTTITTKLISTMQLKFTLTLGYNSKVESGKENLDTQTAVTLVYSF